MEVCDTYSDVHTAVDNGIGAVLEEAEATGETLKVRGSVMLASAESKEQVLQALREDVFHTAGVWDWDKIQVHPVRMSLA